MNKILLKFLFCFGFFVTFIITLGLFMLLLALFFGFQVLNTSKFVSIIVAGIIYQPLFNIAKQKIAYQIGLSESDFRKKEETKHGFSNKTNENSNKKQNLVKKNSSRSIRGRYRN